MAAGRSRWRTWGAVLAAYLLVVQATLTGMTLAAQAAPQPGVFVDVICSPSGSPVDGTSPTSKRHVLPDCCVPGCAMLGGGLGPSPDVAVAAPWLSTRAVSRPAILFDAPSRAPERTPRATRAPPLTA